MWLMVLQILVCLVLVGLVMLQTKGGGLTSAFGGSSMKYSSKKGLEKSLFGLTIVTAVSFLVVSLLNVIF